MLFVFHSLDIIFLDRNQNVIDIHRNVKPFTPLIVPKKKAKYIVEIPSTNKKIGKKIGFKQ